MEEEKRKKEEEERERLYKAELLKKKQHYGKLVREVFRPTVDESKAQELKTQVVAIEKNKIEAQVSKYGDTRQTPGSPTKRRASERCIGSRCARDCPRFRIPNEVHHTFSMDCVVAIGRSRCLMPAHCQH